MQSVYVARHLIPLWEKAGLSRVGCFVFVCYHKYTNTHTHTHTHTHTQHTTHNTQHTTHNTHTHTHSHTSLHKLHTICVRVCFVLYVVCSMLCCVLGVVVLFALTGRGGHLCITASAAGSFLFSHFLFVAVFFFVPIFFLNPVNVKDFSRKSELCLILSRSMLRFLFL